jgi:hypothetical protein
VVVVENYFRQTHLTGVIKLILFGLSGRLLNKVEQARAVRERVCVRAAHKGCCAVHASE